MIGGAPIGTGNIGSFHIDNFIYGVRGARMGLSGSTQDAEYSFEINPPAIGVSGSIASWGVVSFSLPPAIGLSASEVESEVVGSIDFDVNPAGLGLSGVELETDIPLEGVPEFYVNRTPTSATITVTNREGRTIRVFRSDDYNTEFELLTTFSSDSYTDSGLTEGVRYKYKLAFTINISPPLIGRISISKYTK